MKKLSIHIALGCFGLGLGFILTRSVNSELSSHEKARELTRQAREVARPYAGAEPERKGLDRLMRDWKLTKKKSDLRHELESLSLDELRSEMVEISKFKISDDLQLQAYIYAMSEFGAELYRRDGENALEWAMQQDGKWKGALRGVLAPVLNEAAATSPTILKRWLDRLSEDVDFRASAHQISQLAMDRAAERGTDGWIEAAKALDDYWVAGSMAGAPFYPDDFDFSRMLKEVPEGPGVGDAVSYWAAQDKEAAWARLKEFYDSENQDGTFYLGALWQGVATTTGSQDAIDWAVSRLDLIPDEMRERAVYSLIAAGANRSEEFEPLLKSLPRESDRITAAQHMLTTQTNAKQLKLAMNSLPRKEQMAAVLSIAESYRNSYQSGDEYQSAGIAKRLEKPMEILELSDEEKAQVMSRLGDP